VQTCFFFSLVLSEFTMIIDRTFLFCVLAAFTIGSAAYAETVTFENLLAEPETFFKGDTSRVNDDPWSVDGFQFGNSVAFPPFWSGWAYSNTTDSATPGFTNEHSAAPGGGSNGSGGTVGGGTYALAFGSGAWFNLPTGAKIQSVDWTNGTYPAISMEFGDDFAKKFGGESGSEMDYFRATLTGRSGLGGTGDDTGSVTLDLADYTFADDSQDFIVKTWQVNEDLSALGNARSVSLSFESSDTGSFGINTPQYLFIDNLQYSITAIPEPATGVMLATIGIAVVVRRRRRII
jgi:hypothetical protein